MHAAPSSSLPPGPCVEIQGCARNIPCARRFKRLRKTWGRTKMTDHKLTRIRRRARGRIASVNQLDAASPGSDAPGGTTPDGENRTDLTRQSARTAQGMILFLIILLTLLTALWIVL